MKNLKTLAIIRHGDYSGEDLNSYGRQQMRIIAEAIKGLTSGPFVILTSAAPRAKQSAEVIAQILGTEVGYVSGAFWSDNGHPQRNSKFLQELEENIGDAEHAILVSHLEYVEEMPTEISRNEGFNSPAQYRERPKGSGVLLDMVNKQATELRG